MITPARPYRTPTRLAVVLLMILLWGIQVPSAQAAPTDAVAISLEGITPEYLTGDDELRFTGTVLNSGEELTGVTIWWRMHTSVLTLGTYDAWMTEDPALEPITLARHDLVDPIPAGQEHRFDFGIPPESSPFDYGSPSGARGMELVVTATTADGTQISDAVRSTVLWLSPDHPGPTPITLTVPLSPTLEEWTAALEQDVPVAEPAAGRIVGVLGALAAHEVTWGVDAALLDSTPTGRLKQLLPPTEPEDPAVADTPDVLTWETSAAVAEIRTSLESRDGSSPVVSLGWAAPDHRRIAQDRSAGPEVRRLNTAYSDTVFDSVGVTPTASTAWSLVPLSLAEASLLDDATTVILPPTPSGSHVVPPTAQGVMVHSASGDLSELLSSAVTAHELRTLTLIHALSDPHPLATLPADLDAEVAARVAENLEVLTDLPWLQWAPLTKIEDTGTVQGPLLVDPIGEGTVDLTGLLADLSTLDSLESIIERSEQYHAITNTLAFLATSSIWPDDAAEPAEFAAVISDVAATDLLTIERPSTVNLISQGGDLPVGVENHSPISLRPQVAVEPEDARLLVEEQVEAHLGARESTTVMVPITAVANGNVETTIHLVNADGVQIAPPETFTVRVRADWETTGTAIIAGVIAAAFLIGLIRNVRRTPRRHDRSS